MFGGPARMFLRSPLWLSTGLGLIEHATIIRPTTQTSDRPLRDHKNYQDIAFPVPRCIMKKTQE